MGRAFGLILMLAALYVALQLYAEGTERAFGGVFAPIASSERDASFAGALTPAAGLADPPAGAPARRVPVTEAVRERVSADLARGARRRAGALVE